MLCTADRGGQGAASGRGLGQNVSLFILKLKAFLHPGHPASFKGALWWEVGVPGEAWDSDDNVAPGRLPVVWVSRVSGRDLVLGAASQSGPTGKARSRTQDRGPH